MTKKKIILEKVDKQVIIAGIIAITILECFAMHLGFNGTLLKMVLVAIAAMAGFAIPADKIIKVFKK